MKECAIYVRVSTDEQTTDNQLPELRRMARARGFRTVHVFRETASAVGKRPEWERFRWMAHGGRLSALFVWSLDRIGRSMVDNIRAVLDLDAQGVPVLSSREPWLSAQGPTRTLLLAIFSWIAEQERTRLVERTKAGMARARRQGARIGRPKRQIPRRSLELARKLKAKGNTLSQIAMHVKVPRTTLARALS